MSGRLAGSSVGAAGVRSVIVYAPHAGMSDWEPAIHEGAVSTATSHVNVALMLAAHDPVAPLDPALWLPTPAPAQWTRIRKAASDVLATMQILRKGPTTPNGKGEGAQVLWL